jgi:hypothetical protein
MKKNGKHRGNGSNELEGAAESLRNRKIYLNRLEEMGLAEPPVFKRAKMPSAIELARLAAALEKTRSAKSALGTRRRGRGRLEGVGGRPVRRGDGRVCGGGIVFF